MTGITILPLVPVRASQNERSEMTTQLLFGECVEILETQERWLNVRNLNDNHTGWINSKMVCILDKEQELALINKSPYCVSQPLLVCKNSSGEEMFLPGGSLLPAYSNGKCSIANETFTLKSIEETYTESITGEKIAALAKQYLNAPYLWGGKSILGIDCSGLVQVVFSIAGISLPRDSDQQVDNGIVIDFISEAKAGDLAFFEDNEGNIIHVGILLNSKQVIHAVGWVQIEPIDSQGIISTITGKYTHKLRVIKRLV